MWSHNSIKYNKIIAALNYRIHITILNPKLTDSGLMVYYLIHRLYPQLVMVYWIFQHGVPFTYLLTLPLFTGVSRARALSPAWTGSPAPGDINLPHTSFPPPRSPPNKKIKYNKILTYILQSIFLEIPHLELPRWWKTLRDTNGKGV
jgi:hypothetical protein